MEYHTFKKEQKELADLNTKLATQGAVITDEERARKKALDDKDSSTKSKMFEDMLKK